MEDYWEPYVDAVVNELAMKASEYKNPVIDTVFIGGELHPNSSKAYMEAS